MVFVRGIECGLGEIRLVHGSECAKIELQRILIVASSEPFIQR
jgi:hypothetical protein